MVSGNYVVMYAFCGYHFVSVKFVAKLVSVWLSVINVKIIVFIVHRKVGMYFLQLTEHFVNWLPISSLTHQHTNTQALIDEGADPLVIDYTGNNVFTVLAKHGHLWALNYTYQIIW